MERYAWKATLKDGMLAEYIRRHENLWPEMKEMLHQAGIRNYSIWNVDNELFGYYECDSIRTAGEVQARSEINAKWDVYMQDIIHAEKDPLTGAQPLMKQVFLFE